MASVLTDNLTFSPERASEVIFKPIFQEKSILDCFRVIPNVTNQKQLAIAGVLDGITQKNLGCGFSALGNATIEEKVLTVCRLKVNIEQCAADFYDKILEDKLRTGSDIHDLTGTDIEDFIVKLTQEGIRADFDKYTWFGNTASLDPILALLDGVWTKVEAAVTATTVDRVTVASAAAALAVDESLQILEDLYALAPTVLKALPNNEKSFKVSGSVYLNYLKSIENGSCDSACRIQLDGVDVLTFRGIQVIPHWSWDAIAAAEAILPHRVLYTTREALIIGTDVATPGADAMVWHDQKTELFCMKAAFKVGVEIICENLMVVAY